MISIRYCALATVLAIAPAMNVQAEGTFFKPAKQVIPPAETKTAEAPSAAASDEAAKPAYPEVLTGTPQIVDTATLVIDGHRILLPGLEGLTGQYAQDLGSFVGNYGNAVTCTLIGQGPYYRCVTASQNVDLADAALLNGAARVSESATTAQRSKEQQAKDAQRGVWASSSQ